MGRANRNKAAVGARRVLARFVARVVARLAARPIAVALSGLAVMALLYSGEPAPAIAQAPAAPPSSAAPPAAAPGEPDVPAQIDTIMAAEWDGRFLRQFAFHVLPPGADPEMPPDRQLQLSRTIATAILPDLYSAVGIDTGETELRITVGGERGVTAPMLLARLNAGELETDQLAAAFGYVFSQPEVNVTSPGAAQPASAQSASAAVPLPVGGPGERMPYVAVGFEPGVMTVDMAQSFYEKVAGLAVEPLRYVAYGDALLFLPSVDSGLDARKPERLPVYLETVKKALAGFGDAKGYIADAGTVPGEFVENDWSKRPNGEAYLFLIGTSDATLPDALGILRERWKALVTGLVPAEPAQGSTAPAN